MGGRRCRDEFQSPLAGCEPCVGFTANFFAPPAIDVPTDGPQQVFVPATAEEWEQLGIPAPDSLWLMQGAGPNVTDEIGGIPLTPLGGAALTYNVAVAGWSGDFISIPEVADTGLSLNSAAYNPALDDAAALIYGEVLGSVGTRMLTHLGTSGAAVGGGGQLLRMSNLGILSARNDGVDTVGVYNYEADGLVHPFLLRYKRSAPDLGSLNCYTDMEPIVGAVDLTSTNTASKGFNGATTAVPPQWRVRYGAWWYTAAKIAQLGKATLQALRWSLAY